MEEISKYFSSKVFDRLNQQVNPEETMLQFIRNSEKKFGLAEKDLYTVDIDELEAYISMLDDL